MEKSQGYRMTDRILIVTPPSEVVEDQFSILLVGLDQSQTAFISECLKSTENLDITVYLWNEADAKDWLFDKQKKSELIVVNAEMEDQLLVGYFVSNKKTFYIGNLRSLDFLSHKLINNKQNFLQVIDQLQGIYG